MWSQLGTCSWGQADGAGDLLIRLWVGLCELEKGGRGETVCGFIWGLPLLVLSLLVTSGFSKHIP